MYTHPQLRTFVAARTADDASASALLGLLGCIAALCAICARFQFEFSAEALL